MIDFRDRYELLEKDSKLSLRHQARLLGVDRWKYYYKPKSDSALNLYLMRLIDQKYQVCPFFGVPSMTDYLNGLGLQPINKKRVERLYKTMDIRALGHKPNTSKSDPTSYKYPYLLRNLEINHSNQVWAADITFLPMRRGYMYLFAIIDLYSRYIFYTRTKNSNQKPSSNEPNRYGVSDMKCPEGASSPSDCSYTPYSSASVPCIGGEVVSVSCSDEPFQLTATDFTARVHRRGHAFFKCSGSATR